MPRPKSHLFVTETNLCPPGLVKVVCGESVQHPMPIYCGEDASTVAVTCRACQKAEFEKPKGLAWHYAIVNGQEAKLEGNDAD